MKNYREKVLGCWLGKAVGGTLGQPYEGSDGPLELSYYNPVPEGMIPNDDLDLQVLWACVLDGMKDPLIARDVFSGAWVKNVEFPWDEYGIAIRNLRNGIKAPHSGSYGNWFKDGLGAAIRSEIWACLAPGKPKLAADFAYEDACVDHVGDGIYAEQFLSALESAAFLENDINRLLDAGLSVIPGECRLAKAIGDVRLWSMEGGDWLEIRRKILGKWGSENFTDVVMNISFLVMALILGKGDFSTTVCLAVNCGRDADCTAASAGAIMGIINPDGIAERWLKPIGRDIILNKGIVGITPPATLDEFTDMVSGLKDKVRFNGRRESSSFNPAKVKVECGIYHPWFAQDENKFAPKMPGQAEIREFHGNIGSIPSDKIPSDSLYLMRFKFRMEERKKVRVMFNTDANSRIWVDGNFVFGREGGRMAPSFHRCPINQYRDMELEPGEHELVAGIAPISGQEEITWVWGIGDCRDLQWLGKTEVLEREERSVIRGRRSVN